MACAWFFGGGGWNQNASFDLTRALVERRTFAIDAYRGNTYDVSFHGGHVYANKAPGISLIAVIPYAAALAAERAAGFDPDSFIATTLNLYVCGVATCAVAGALLAALFFAYARRKGFGAVPSAGLALTLAFATYLFAYSTVFFAHVPTALFLFWSFARLAIDPDRRPWIAGALGGAAVLCNYTALLPLAVIITAAVLMPGARATRVGAIVLGGLPFAAGLLAYQAACFGAPLRTSVEATSGVFLTKGAFLGVFLAPRLSVLFAILVSRYRGLLFLSPVLVFAAAGYVVSARRRLMTRDCAVSGGVVAALLLINACFNNWDGGSAIGPRYILPAVPFLGVPMLLAGSILPRLRAALLVVSLFFNFAVVAVNPLPSRLVADPILRYTLPLLFTGSLPAGTPLHPPLAWTRMLGHVSVNRLSADEMVAFMKHPPGSFEAEWASFNLGEIAAEGSPLSLAPIVVWMAVGALVLMRMAARVPE